MERFFYLNSNNEQAGPISPTEFDRYGVNESSMIWKQGMPNWMRAGQIPELLPYLRPSTPPPPVGGNRYKNNSYHSGGNVPSGDYGRNGFNNGSQYKPMKPDNNMIWAILSTVLCCLPFGIYAIIQASKVNGLYNSGNYAEAQAMADSAKKWAGVGAIIGLVGSVIYALLLILAGA